MKLHDLKPNKGSKQRKKRVGRGNASGLGTYSTRGMKGQKSRSGASFYPGFEGGRTPLIKLIPKKRGFKSLKPEWEIINISDLQSKFKAGAVVNKSDLKKAGLIRSKRALVKLLGVGEITKKLTVIVDACSGSAKSKIEKVGGKVDIKVRQPESTSKSKGKSN